MNLYTVALSFTSKIIPLIAALTGFGILVTVHEFGHFLFCKLFGIHTPTFSIGFGPEIFRKKIGGTDFRLAILPLGGYVEIAGLQEVGQGDQEFAQEKGRTSFDNKPFWQKFLVLTGGILFNIILAYGLFTAVYIVGSGDPHGGITLSTIIKESAAEKSNLEIGDQIVAINKNELKDENDTLIPNALKIVLNNIVENPAKTISIDIVRNGERTTKKVTVGTREINGEKRGVLGAGFHEPYARLPFFEAIKAGIRATNQWICNITQSVKYLITQRTLEGAGGPLMILAQTFTSAQHGIIELFIFLAIMSINLALINVLPLGILDGGQLLLVVIEAITRRRIPDSIRIGLALLSWGLFVPLALYLTYKDTIRLFGSNISSLYQMVASYLGF